MNQNRVTFQATLDIRKRMKKQTLVDKTELQQSRSQVSRGDVRILNCDQILNFVLILGYAGYIPGVASENVYG